MAFSDHEVNQVLPVYFSMEQDGKGNLRPTLWDTPAPDRSQAVCLVADDGRVEIHTDREIVEACLEA